MLEISSAPAMRSAGCWVDRSKTKRSPLGPNVEPKPSQPTKPPQSPRVQSTSNLPDYAPLQYDTFGRYQDPGMRFEPSGVAALRTSNRFLVVNDKSDAAQFSIYELGADGMLREQRSFDVTQNGTSVVEKLEDCTASHKEPGTYWAITSFTGDRASPKRKLVRLQINADTTLGQWQDMPIADPRDIVRELVGETYAKVEGLALTPSEERLLVGVRAFGPSQTSRRYGVLLLAYSTRDLTQRPQVIAHLDLKPLLGRSEGISGIEYSAKLGGYLILTSYEDDDQPGLQSHGVGGHLWFVRDLARLDHIDEWRKLPRIRLEHKPEGVTLAPDGRIVVVYDDDHRKSTDGRPGTFKLLPHEAAYSLISVDQLQVP
ncbi:MAG: hypothetical protein R3C68_13670 [Myxococcota bacterium]